MVSVRGNVLLAIALKGMRALHSSHFNIAFK